MHQRGISTVSLLVIAIIVFILISLGLLFRNNITSFFSSNTQNNGSQGFNNQQTINDTERFFEAGSLIPGYDLGLINAQNLVGALEELNIYGRQYIYTDKQTTGERPVVNVLVLLRESSQGGENLFEDNVYITLTNGSISLDFILTQDQLDDPNIQEYIIKTTLNNIYRLTYKDAPISEVNSKVDEVYDKLLEANPEYITVTKE